MAFVFICIFPLMLIGVLAPGVAQIPIDVIIICLRMGHKATFTHPPQPLRRHMQSFRTLKQPLVQPLSGRKEMTQRREENIAVNSGPFLLPPTPKGRALTFSTQK